MATGEQVKMPWTAIDECSIWCSNCGEPCTEDDLRDGLCATCRDSRHTNGVPVQDEGRD